MATLDFLKQGMLPSGTDALNKGIDTGVKLATMQEKIQQEKQQVEQQQLSIDQAKFDGALKTMKSFSVMDTKVQGMSEKYLSQKLMDYGFANAPMLLQTLKSDDAAKFMVNNIASAKPEELAAIGIDPKSGVQGIMAMTDPLAFRSSIQDINDRLIKFREGARTERIADKRIEASEAAADRRAGVSSEKEAKKDKQNAVKAQNDILADLKKEPQYKSMAATAAAFEKINNNAADTGPAQQALVFSFSKILDEGSVVRETEYAQSAANAGRINQALQYFNKLKEGKALAPGQIKYMKDVANDLVQAARGTLDSTIATYEARAVREGYDPSYLREEDPFKKYDKKKAPTPKFNREAFVKQQLAKGKSQEEIEAFLKGKGL